MIMQEEKLIRRLAALEEELQRLKRSLVTSREQLPELSLPMLVVVVRVAGLWLALPISVVRQVAAMVWVSPLPRAPAAVRGTVTFRGRLVPVLDLHFSLSGVREPLTTEMMLLFVATGERVFALTIDDVSGVTQIEAEDVESGADTSSLPSFVSAVFRSDERPVSLIEPAALLAAGETEQLQGLLSTIDRDLTADRSSGEPDEPPLDRAEKAPSVTGRSPRSSGAEAVKGRSTSATSRHSEKAHRQRGDDGEPQMRIPRLDGGGKKGR